MLFMRFPWCDYDKEALRASDVKKRGDVNSSLLKCNYKNQTYKYKSDYLNCTVFAIAKVLPKINFLD